MTAAGEWTGDVGNVWALEWPHTERSFGGLEPLLRRAILGVAPDYGNFLDLGCGVGTTGAAIAAARPNGRITGVDLSAAMVAVARQRYDAPNLRFVAGDALALATADRHDLVFSRHGVMFFADPVDAFTRLRRRTKSGAPLVFSCFRARSHNTWAVELASATGQSPGNEAAYAPGPFGFGAHAFVADLLARTGWRVETSEAVDFDYVAGEGRDNAAALADALAFFTRIGPAAAAIRAARGHARADLLARIGTRLARYARDGRVAMPASAWIWTARAAGEPV